MTKKSIRWIARGIVILFLLYGIVQLVGAMTLWGIPPSNYSKKDLIANYQARKTQILEVKNFFTSIVPPHKHVEIEFTDDHTLGRLEVCSLDSTTGAFIYPIFLKWNLATTSRKVDSVIGTLHWTMNTLQQLKQKLDSAHCISARNEEPCQIGFQRSGMGMYFYDLFTKPIPDSIKDKYNDGCTHIFYNPTVVLEYGGGAIGPQCFPKD
jgi:hypothetical protein